jgi:hypothetical protein
MDLVQNFSVIQLANALAFSIAQTLGSWQMGQRVGSTVFICTY